MTRNSPTVRADDAKSREQLGDEVRVRREAEILARIAGIEKAAVSAQAAELRSENNRLKDLLVREAHALETAETALNALRREHEEVKRDLGGRLDEAYRRTRRLASVAATQIGRAFTAGAFEGRWPLRGWLLRRRASRLRQSGLVNPGWYLARNPDVAAAGMDPVLHYLLHGAAEGRAPNPALEDPPED